MKSNETKLIEYRAENLIIVMPEGSTYRSGPPAPKDDHSGEHYDIPGWGSWSLSELEEIAAVYLFNNPDAKESRVWLEDVLTEKRLAGE